MPRVLSESLIVPGVPKNVFVDVIKRCTHDVLMQCTVILLHETHHFMSLHLLHT